MFNLKSVKTNKLKFIEILEICKLKNTNPKWKNSQKKQLSWFKKNVKKNDINNLVYYNYELVAYNLLRNLNCKIMNKKKKFFLFENLIVKKNYRRFSVGELLMNFNNLIIKKNKIFSFLICDDDVLGFYQKFKWKKISKKKFSISKHKFSSNLLAFNFYEKKNFNLYINNK